MPTRSLSYEVSDDGYLMENGVWISSGTIVPVHSGEAGDIYFRSGIGTEEQYKNTSDPSPGTTWTLITDMDAKTLLFDSECEQLFEMDVDTCEVIAIEECEA